ncbi:1-phosphatidylinositol phosphodiesterase [Ceratocystis platani]|uniref:1-phosphatidylinositol phosphodiesterase n=1 Tax=Ceratocystis fimbriata f. sp. platani TaxID=88771 RepID=A0A0F8CN62_CERFI|nr:1-phosphatidylinositol phosphodiesterase [Ceratocystis platani]
MRFSFFATLACLAFGKAAAFKGIDDGWSFDLDEANHADWMDIIPDSRLLSDIVIPGTHNSVTDKLTSSLMQTQNVPLEQQLIGGIRYVDITCKVTKNGLMVYHGLDDTGYSFGNVLGTIFAFLDQHQRETVILRIQMGGVFKSSEAFAESLEQTLTSSSYLNVEAADRLYSRADGDISSIPTLGTLRGKVFILENFKTSTPGRYGLPWNKNTVSNYGLTFSASTTSMDSKWDDIKSHLSGNPWNFLNKLRITHTTASVGVCPINFAARTAPKVGMNTHLGKYLADKLGDCFGIIAMDFPGKHLVDQILQCNEEYEAASFYAADRAGPLTSTGAPVNA